VDSESKGAAGLSAMMRTIWQTLLWKLGCEMGPVDLISPCPYAECVARLRQNTNSSWAFFGPYPVNGYVDEKSFALRQKKYRPEVLMRGTFADESRQTRLCCLFRTRHLALPAAILSLLMILLAGGPVFVKAVFALIKGSTSTPTLVGLTVLPLLLVLYIMLLNCYRASSRNERRFLLNFLIETLDARKVPSTAEAHTTLWVMAIRCIDPSAE
jgi:hypothetical protein